MRRWILAVLGLALIISSCGRGYEGENRSIVDELPAFDGLDLIDEDHYGYCSGDTCLFGNDRSGALLMYTVDTDRYTMLALTEAYRDALPLWEPSIEEGCVDGDLSSCDDIVFASFTRGDEQISLNLDNWQVGQFELHVDAKGGA